MIERDCISEDLAADLAWASFGLAKNFHAGATMWTLAPGWDPHALHIAVEFIHPVIVGKRALPAAALSGPNLVDAARVAVRPGDVVVAVAAADDPQTSSVMQRAPAWGVTSIWLGSGPRPPAGAADHVVWLDDADPRGLAIDDFVLLYHLLWELTHVCFEHPGLLTVAECTDEVCITCGDEGRLGEVISAPEPGSARVRTSRGVETVSTALVEPITAEELVLVHAGMALSKVPDGVCR